MNATERGIFEQFSFWATAPNPAPLADASLIHVFVGCGTSFYIAQALAAATNAHGQQAIAVTGGEWWHRPDYYLAAGRRAHVIVLSRSGESTETVRAAEASQKAGHKVTALTCAEGSAITKFADTVLYAPTHADEGIVMTSSASLMLLMGLRLSEGVSAARFAARTGMPLAQALDPVILAAAIEEGYLVQEGDRLCATPEGRMRLDALLGALLR